MTKPATRDRFAEFRAQLREVVLPTKTELEHAVENHGVCGTCQGKVRAMIEDGQRVQGGLADLDMLVHVWCRNAACGWEARQWRPWSKSRPLEL